MRTSTDIEKEIEKAKVTIGSLEKELAEQQRAVATLAQRRRKFAFAAHGEGDAKAKNELSKAHTATLEANLKVEDLHSAISAGREKAGSLQREFEEAAKAEHWATVQAMCHDLEGDAKNVDKAIEALVDTLAGHQKKINLLRAEAQQAGRENFAHAAGLRHAARRLDSLLFAATGGSLGSGGAALYRETPYSEILSRQLRNQEVDEGETEAA